MDFSSRDCSLFSAHRRSRGGLFGRAGALLLAALACLGVPLRAEAAPSLLMDLGSGAVLYEDHATQPWFPASLTKLMTVYVALQAVRDHRIAFDTALIVSPRAAAMPPSKMGFRPGTMVTLDTALKILMVKSANDVSVTVAEGVSGSVAAFAAEMNATAAALGMQQSHFVNPNGLPDPQHYSSARDLALLARALYLTFPEHADLFSIGALEIGGKVMANHNNLLGRYPGVDGMKTGFTCAAGFNVVASATQGGRKLVAVILGAPNVALRTVKAAALFDRGFAGIDRPSLQVAALPLQGGAPPDNGASICRSRGAAIVAFNAENERLLAPLEASTNQAFASSQGASFYDSSALSRISPMATRIALVPPPNFDPVPIRIAGYAGANGAAESRGGDADEEPASVSAFAPKSGAIAGAAKLAPDAKALPMKGAKAAAREKAAERAATRHRHHGAAATASAKARGKAVAVKEAKGRRHGAAKEQASVEAPEAKPIPPHKGKRGAEAKATPPKAAAAKATPTPAGKGAQAPAGKKAQAAATE
ncbi:D-alanyl-D-alanine carboxypeptidase family protein [Methylocella silvestris]|uniref:D-alanyl-D-alanine carboxypeptidase family protein n=1 Tax=Methylocella silvestris TaxID=199596 RepID=UPI0011AF1A71|nr:D-alanyl-D-alanine carboxypeptidase family protein [Methylocella silvestris]